MRPFYVAVCGPNVAPTEQQIAWAEEVGRHLAREGCILVTGGLGGVMAAASKGAREEGGTVVGIIPSERHEAANPHCTVVIPSGLGEARNALVVRAGDAVIAIGGEFGTLSEIALARKIGLTVVGIDTWQPSKGGMPVEVVKPARDPEEAVRIALVAAKARREQGR